MPLAAVIPISARFKGEYALVQVALPGQPLHDVGVLLIDADPDSSRYALRLRSHWEDLAEPEDAAYLAALELDFQVKIAQGGARRLLESWEDSWSHLLRISQRESVEVDSFARMADRIFGAHVEKLPVQPFRTHLPLYTLRAAAGKFGADESVEEEDWVRVPETLRLAEGMFVAHVEGRSMEPRIADRSLNVFRAPVVGSRQNKIVLVELIGVHEKFTVKKYTSRKASTGEDQWQHQAIRLQPLNPEFEPLDLQPDQLKVVAEWILTLE